MALIEMNDYGYFKRCEILVNISETPDKEIMQVTFLKGTETLSELFKFTLGIQTQNPVLSTTDVIGKFVTLTLIAKTEKKEYKSYKTGYIASVKALKNPYHRTNTYRYFYEVELIPRFAFLQHHHDCRIFKNKNSLEIIESIFNEHGFSASRDYKITVKNTLAKTAFPICAQYQESDYQFIQRLMAACGMFYYFKHSKTKQELIIQDNNHSIEACEMEMPPYLIDGQSIGESLLAGFYNLFFHQALPEINVRCNSYDPQDPSKFLLAKSEGVKSHITKSYLSSHPQFGTFISDTQLKSSELNQAKSEELFNQAKYALQHISIESTLPTVAVAHTFSTNNSNFKSYLGSDCADKYFINSISYDIKLIEAQHGTLLMGDSQRALNNVHEWFFQLLAFPSNNPIPAISSSAIPPSPIVGIIHHAYVVDKEGKLEADGTNAVSDEFGMPYIGIQWDQKTRDNPSGKKYQALNSIFPRPAGFFDLPHPGETVKVQFSDWYSLPIVLGVTGDSKNYKFPITDLKTQTKILSRPPSKSLKEVNQILLDDKQNNQILFVDAPCQFTIYAAKDNDKPKFKLTVDKKGNLVIEANSVEIKSTSGDISLNSAANLSLEAKKSITISAGSKMTLKAKTSMDTTSGTSMSIKANASLNVKAATGTIDGGGMLTLKAGVIKEN